MTEKSVPAAIEIAASANYKNRMGYFERNDIISYVLGSANDDELNFRKTVAQEYIKLIESRNNGKNITEADEIRGKLFESKNDQELNKAIKEIKSKYNLTLNVNDANAAIKAYAWGDAEKKAMAEKCIKEISKYYEIPDNLKEYVFKTASDFFNSHSEVKECVLC